MEGPVGLACFTYELSERMLLKRGTRNEHGERENENANETKLEP